MTVEQRYHRRLARKYGLLAVGFALSGTCDPDYHGYMSLHSTVRAALWHAFKAHPELREVTA